MTTATLTAPVDVNANFDTERGQLIKDIETANANADQAREQLQADTASRVAEGKLVSLGGGRFRVNDPGSWDNNEVWTYRDFNGTPLLMPQPELATDERDGKIKLYTRQPEWHTLGQVVPEGLIDIQAVLQASGLDYRVIQIPNTYTYRPKGTKGKTPTFTVPGEYINIREDTGQPFKTVGRIYTPLQNREAFEFLQALANDGDITWETAGETTRGTVFVSMKLPESLTIDAGGLDDRITLYVVAFNSHDGQSPFKVVVTPWRPRCGNTNRWALRDAVTSWTVRHTTNANQKFAEARRTLGLSLKYGEKMIDEETALARCGISLSDVDALINSIWTPDEDEGKVARANRDRRHGEIRECFALEEAASGRTAYAAENAISDWLDHAAPRRTKGDNMAAARATAILEGSDDDKKGQAHRQLLTLTNR